jgi:hypothetical protein
MGQAERFHQELELGERALGLELLVDGEKLGARRLLVRDLDLRSG